MTEQPKDYPDSREDPRFDIYAELDDESPPRCGWCWLALMVCAVIIVSIVAVIGYQLGEVVFG